MYFTYTGGKRLGPEVQYMKSSESNPLITFLLLYKIKHWKRTRWIQRDFISIYQIFLYFAAGNNQQQYQTELAQG